MRKFQFVGLIACGFLTFVSPPCSAATLIWGNGTSQGGEHSMTDVPGEQLELAGSSPLSNLTFSWGQRPGAPGTFSRVAFGDVYILSAPYTGTPANLSTASNILAVVSSADITTDNTGSYWNFSKDTKASVRGFTLQPGTLYYFYSDQAPSGTLYYTDSDYTSSAANPNEARFFASSISASFQSTSATSNNYFELTGAAVPEPTSFIPASLAAVAGLGYFSWQRRKVSPACS